MKLPEVALAVYGGYLSDDNHGASTMRRRFAHAQHSVNQVDSLCEPQLTQPS